MNTCIIHTRVRITVGSSVRPSVTKLPHHGYASWKPNFWHCLKAVTLEKELYPLICRAFGNVSIEREISDWVNSVPLVLPWLDAIGSCLLLLLVVGMISDTKIPERGLVSSKSFPFSWILRGECTANSNIQSCKENITCPCWVLVLTMLWFC